MNPKSITLQVGAGLGWFDIDQAVAITPLPGLPTDHHTKTSVLYLTERGGYVLASYHDEQWFSGEELYVTRAAMSFFAITEEVPAEDTLLEGESILDFLYEVGSVAQLDAWRALIHAWEQLEV
jgi:hypothetical protein